MYDLSWLNPTPHAIAVYASQPTSPLATQHSLPSGRCPLLGPDLHRLDRTSSPGALIRSPPRVVWIAVARSAAGSLAARTAAGPGRAALSLSSPTRRVRRQQATMVEARSKLWDA